MGSFVRSIVKRIAPKPKRVVQQAAPAPAPAPAPKPVVAAPVVAPPPPPPPPPVFRDSQNIEYSTAEARDAAQAQINRRKKFAGTSVSETTSVQTLRIKKGSAGRPNVRVSKLGSVGSGQGSGVAIS